MMFSESFGDTPRRKHYYCFPRACLSLSLKVLQLYMFACCSSGRLTWTRTKPGNLRHRANACNRILGDGVLRARIGACLSLYSEADVGFLEL